ncbi:MAG: DUF2461 domain-containing protein [Hyphomicrobiaceae bacterium]|nr:DUF2461 domain-containing protein [Hyphomicrobiaceae bacterium]MCC0023243.1 DUF2461 domain-containing protein [Hyphomicrobiaceae bacterium]
MAFEGFPREVTAFFRGLRDNNSKEWFDQHAAEYERVVRKPSLALISDLTAPLIDLDPPLKAEPRLNGSLRRINRDIRFSADKTPYQTYQHLIFWVGDHPNRSPGVHLIIGAKGFGFGSGQWALEAGQLGRVRQAIIADKGKSLQRALDEAASRGARISEPALKRVPAGFDPQSDVAEFLKHKGFVVRADQEQVPEEMYDSRGVDYVLELCRALNPVNAFLMQNAGEED